MPAWLQATPKGWTLQLYVQPGAKTTQVVGEHDGALKLRLQAPPIEGRANQYLIAWLAELLGIPRHTCVLLSGETQRRKRLQIEAVAGLDTAKILSLLVPCAS